MCSGTVSHYFFDCNQHAAPHIKLLASAALLFCDNWLNASRKTRPKWFLNDNINITDISYFVNKCLFVTSLEIAPDIGDLPG